MDCSGCVTGIITAWALIAWRLRDEAEKYNVSTFTGYLTARHGKKAGLLGMLSSAAIVFFFFFYVGAQFLGGGKTLHTIFGLNPATGAIITALVIIPYTVYGGFRSVVYTDVIQAILMIITLIIGPVAGIIYITNHNDVYASGLAEALIKSGSSYTSLTGMTRGFGAGLIITGGFSWFFGYLGGLPQLSIRFMAISNPEQAKKARNIGIVWTVIAYTGALIIGWLGIAIFGPAAMTDPEFVMPQVLLKLFHPVIATILITGAIAAIISTADSLLILSATEFSENLLGKNGIGYGQNAAVSSLRRHRIITALLALVALGLSFVSPSRLIFTIVSYVWAGIGCTLSVVVLFSLFWKRFHGRAAIITVISGLLFTFFWISGGFEQHYRITKEKIDFLDSQKIISPEQKSVLINIEGLQRVSPERFEKVIRQTLHESASDDNISIILSAFIRKGVPARLTTFIFSLIVAVISVYLVPPGKT